MSYILDALRKADAERERDPARGIHARPAAQAGANANRRTSLQWPWVLAAGLILAGATWLWSRGGDAVSRPVAVTASSPVESIAASPPATSPAPATVVLPAPAQAVIEVPRPVPPQPVQQAAVAPRAAQAPAPAAAERTYTLADLPADVQQAMPKLAVSGGVYSENVAQRMLVVNGQVFNEGSEVAPGVVLEQVRPRDALLKFRGLRVTQPY
jgi:general secretion pathway protein B